MNGEPDGHPLMETPVSQTVAVFTFGAVFVTVLLVIAFVIEEPTPSQYEICRIILALSVACVATLLTGFVNIEIPRFLNAGGSFAVFVIVYFYSPAALVVGEIDKARKIGDV